MFWSPIDVRIAASFHRFGECVSLNTRWENPTLCCSLNLQIHIINSDSSAAVTSLGLMMTSHRICCWWHSFCFPKRRPINKFTEVWMDRFMCLWKGGQLGTGDRKKEKRGKGGEKEIPCINMPRFDLSRHAQMVCGANKEKRWGEWTPPVNKPSVMGLNSVFIVFFVTC